MTKRYGLFFAFLINKRDVPVCTERALQFLTGIVQFIFCNYEYG